MVLGYRASSVAQCLELLTGFWTVVVRFPSDSILSLGLRFFLSHACDTDQYFKLSHFITER